MSGVLTRKRAKIDVLHTQAVPPKLTRPESSTSNESSKSYRPKSTYITFEYGPSDLNLYKYVAEEYQFIWRKTKEIYVLKKDSEPLDGFILLHGDTQNVEDLCMDLFGFDAKTTKSEDRKTIPTEVECVVVCYLGKLFWKEDKITFENVRKAVKSLKQSRLFFIIESEDTEKRVAFVKKQNICPACHVIRANSDNSVIFDALYGILEKKLKLLITDLESRTTTRQVAALKTQLESLEERLQERKPKAPPKLTEACVQKLKAGRRFGVVGYRLCEETLYVFENEQSRENQLLPIAVRQSIQNNFKGEVLFRTLTESSYNPHCAVKCGGLIVNNLRTIQGTIGIFGEIRGNLPENLRTSSTTVALTSAHIFKEGEFAFTREPFGRIGRCIWPKENESPSISLHNIAVIQIDPSVLESLNRHIYNETVVVDDLTEDFLSYRKVFKYGGITGETTGTIEKIAHFAMFGKKVMIILPKRTEDAQRKFSDKGDSGAIVLTRDRGQLYVVGMVFGDDFDHHEAECRSSSNECIAINFKDALDRFTRETQIALGFDRI